jgi:hypothetical protein
MGLEASQIRYESHGRSAARNEMSGENKDQVRYYASHGESPAVREKEEYRLRKASERWWR